MTRTLILLPLAALTLLISACGFQLRGSANLPYETLHVAAAPTSAVANEIRRSIASGSNTRVIADPKQAQATLHLLGEEIGRAHV